MVRPGLAEGAASCGRLDFRYARTPSATLRSLGDSQSRHGSPRNPASSYSRTGSEGTQRSNWTPKYLLRCRYIRICVQYLHRQQSAIAQPLNGYCSINQMAKTQRYLRAIACARYLLPGRTKRPENCWTCCLRMTAEQRDPRSRHVYKNCN
jgi:hypothetical protein